MSIFKNIQKVRKIDMLVLGDNNFEFRGGGLFETTDTWIHPKRLELTYEIIYVVSGEIYLYEEDKKYALKENNLLILKKGLEHGGYLQSTGKTSFYWIHFDIDNFDSLGIPESFLKNFSSAHLFRKLLHYDNISSCPSFTCDVLAASILCEISAEAAKTDSSSKLVQDVYEWIRINASNKLSSHNISEHFSYNSEYLSRLLKKEYGKGMKEIISGFVAEKAKNLLLNSNYSIKEIAGILKFPDSTSFINFFKYHEKSSPRTFRNNYPAIHMNK